MTRLALIAAQAFAIGLNGWRWGFLGVMFGTPGPTQAGMGLGAALTTASFLMLLCDGLAARGWCRGDAFVVGAIASVLALTIIFVFFPVSIILASAVQDDSGAFAPGEFVGRFLDSSIWGLDCLASNLRCGVAWNTLFLAVLVGFGTTGLGLAFALIATRTAMRFKGARNLDNAKKWYDWALTPRAQEIAVQGKSYQIPSAKGATIPPEAPKLSEIKLIDFDFAKYGSSAERRRLLSKWHNEVKNLPK